MMRRLLVLVVLAAAFVLALPLVPAMACSCAHFTPEQHFERADAIFAARVADVDLGPPTGTSSRFETVTFRLTSVYKGAPAKNQIAITESTGASCGYRFTLGDSYLVFAKVEGETYSTTLCAGTTNDLTYLDRAGFSPSPFAVAAPTTASLPASARGARTLWLLGAGIALAMATAALVRSARS